MRTIVISLAVLALGAGWSLGRPPAAAPAASVADRLGNIATGMNAITPKTLAGGLVLRAVHADGTTLVAQFDGVPDWHPAYSDDEMRRMVSAGMCARGDVTTVLGEGAKVRFDFISPTGATLPSLTIDHCG